MVCQQKVEIIAKKQQKNRKKICLSIENNGYYDNKTSTNPNKKNSLNLVKNNKNWKFST